MNIREVTPQPEAGQFWACLEPLTLVQVKIPGEITIFRAWTVEKLEEEWCVLTPLTRYRFLWHRGSLPKDYFGIKVNPGDVLMDQGTGVLYFVGPSEKQDEVVILSDETGSDPHRHKNSNRSGRKRWYSL